MGQEDPIEDSVGELRKRLGIVTDGRFARYLQFEKRHKHHLRFWDVTALRRNYVMKCYTCGEEIVYKRKQIRKVLRKGFVYDDSMKARNTWL